MVPPLLVIVVRSNCTPNQILFHPILYLVEHEACMHCTTNAIYKRWFDRRVHRPKIGHDFSNRLASSSASASPTSSAYINLCRFLVTLFPSLREIKSPQLAAIAAHFFLQFRTYGDLLSSSILLSLEKGAVPGQTIHLECVIRCAGERHTHGAVWATLGPRLRHPRFSVLRENRGWLTGDLPVVAMDGFRGLYAAE